MKYKLLLIVKKENFPSHFFSNWGGQKQSGLPSPIIPGNNMNRSKVLEHEFPFRNWVSVKSRKVGESGPGFPILLQRLGS